MAPPFVSNEDLLRTIKALEAAKGHMSTAAQALGLSEPSVRRHEVEAIRRKLIVKPVRDSTGRYVGAAEPQGAAESAAEPEDRYSVAFWRRAANEAQRDLEATRHTLREVSGLVDTPLAPPEWTLPQGSEDARPCVGLLHISDLHANEEVNPAEINGWNRYNNDIFRARFRRYIAAACEIVPRWAADGQLQGAVVALNGDLISGDIHDELRRTNSMTSQQQVLLVADEISAAIPRLVEYFGQIWIVVTPGNHGRTTEKTHAKRTTELNYDSLIGQLLKREFAGNPNVHVYVAPGRDAVYPVLGWTIFQSHGDALGTGGGKGFAGAMLPIVRGAKAVEHQGALVRQYYDIILTAHYHTSGNPGAGILANGSMVGYNEFAHSIRARIDVPRQWLALITERWGLRERIDVALEDPVKSERPRFRPFETG